MKKNEIQFSRDWLVSQQEPFNFEGSRSYQAHIKSDVRIPHVSFFYSLKYIASLQRKFYNMASFTYLGVSYSSIYWSGDKIEFVAVSPPLESKDGEYHTNLVRWDAFERVYKKEDWGDLEMSLLSDGLNIEIFSTVEGDLPDFIENARVALKTLIWLMSNHQKLSIRQMSNLPENYNKVIEESRAKYNVTDIPFKELRVYDESNRQPHCGVKLSLMTLREAGHPMNIEYPVWRELVLMQWCSDTVINRRCISFPLYGDSAYVEGHIDNVVSNQSLSRRLDEDTVARHALRKLDESRQIIDQKPNFRYWDRRVFEAIQVAERDLIISDSAIISVMEDVGDTWGSIPEKGSLRESLLQQNMIKIMFDVCYAAYILHDVAVHGDLHVNNITFRVYKAQAGTEHSLYILTDKGEMDTFALPFTKTAVNAPTGFIIDFSQSVITHPDKVTENIPENFYKSQLQQVLRILRRWMPKFLEKNQEQISGLALTDMNKLSKALAFVDYYAISQSVCQRFPGAFAEKMQKMTLQMLTKNLLIAIGKDDSKMTSEVEFFHKLFSKYEYRKQEITNVKTIVAAPLPMRHSGRKYETFPPWAKAENFLKNSNLSLEEWIHMPSDPYENEKYKDRDLVSEDIVAEMASAQFRDGPPVQVGVTWF